MQRPASEARIRDLLVRYSEMPTSDSVGALKRMLMQKRVSSSFVKPCLRPPSFLRIAPDPDLMDSKSR